MKYKFVKKKRGRTHGHDNSVMFARGRWERVRGINGDGEKVKLNKLAKVFTCMGSYCIESLEATVLFCLSDSVLFKEFLGKALEEWLVWLKLTHKTPRSLEEHFNA